MLNYFNISITHPIVIIAGIVGIVSALESFRFHHKTVAHLNPDENGNLKTFAHPKTFAPHSEDEIAFLKTFGLSLSEVTFENDDNFEIIPNDIIEEPMFTDFKANEDGTLLVDECISQMQNEGFIDKDQITNWCQNFDKNRDLKISSAEFHGRHASQQYGFHTDSSFKSIHPSYDKVKMNRLVNIIDFTDFEVFPSGGNETTVIKAQTKRSLLHPVTTVVVKLFHNNYQHKRNDEVSAIKQLSNCGHIMKISSHGLIRFNDLPHGLQVKIKEGNGGPIVPRDENLSDNPILWGLVISYGNAGTLASLKEAGKLVDEHMLYIIFRHYAKTLKCMNVDHSLSHRNIKPDHLVVNKVTTRISKLKKYQGMVVGFSLTEKHKTIFNQCVLGNIKGTEKYIPSFKGAKSITEKCLLLENYHDILSLGVTLGEIITPKSDAKNLILLINIMTTRVANEKDDYNTFNVAREKWENIIHMLGIAVDSTVRVARVDNTLLGFFRDAAKAKEWEFDHVLV